MMDALATPLFRSLLVAALATASIAAVVSTRDEATTRRLKLHAPSAPNSYYLTAWEGGDVYVTFPDSRLQGVEFRNRAWIFDGCRWQGTEKLTPISDREFFYEYSEVIIECKAGATPTTKTPRTGRVTVED